MKNKVKEIDVDAELFESVEDGNYEEPEDDEEDSFPPKLYTREDELLEELDD